MTQQVTGRVVLAAGGTGGHMFPAQALARELLARGVKVALATDRRGGGFGPGLPQVETCLINAGGVAGQGPLGKAMNIFRLGLGYLQARRFIKTCAADTIVGFGGYASAPTVLAGSHLGRRIVLHEQNAVLGRANRMLASHAEIIATSFSKVDGVPESCTGKVRVAGNPVRPAIAALGTHPYVLPGKTDAIRILVTGGSQGASVFNDVVPKALCLLPDSLRTRIEISQQVRGPQHELIAEAYDACGISHDLRGFFDDMPERLVKAHLVICRAGASTISELTAAGRPGLLVPYPFAADDHQSANARRLTEAGGGWLIPQATLTAPYLAERLESLFSNPAILAKTSRCARAAAHNDAAKTLAEIVCRSSNDNGDSRTQRGEAAA